MKIVLKYFAKIYTNFIIKVVYCNIILYSGGMEFVRMLKLNDIVKVYDAGSMQVNALKGVSMEFRQSEFVSILGQSGCGKTTLLNIIGGLDQYTSGDLIINGKSTKQYKDSDWDSYRNHRIGFVFQSYNLISHQTVLSNVELALTLSGVGKAERKRRAMEALESGGRMDRQELTASRKVLTAAALTYVAALASSLLSLLRLIVIANRRR
jgi:ABC-type Fe3+/spermidine/putrescine transport system ATPase subunit